MARYTVWVETSAESVAEGGYLAHVQELPGCVARGKTLDAALARIREAIAAYHALARKHHAPAPIPEEPVELDVREMAGYELPSDFEPFREEDLDYLRELAGISRGALLETVNQVPPDAHKWRPAPGEYSLEEILVHIARADLYLASRLEQPGLPELSWRLAVTRAALLHRVRGLPAGDRRQTTVHEGEAWTPRKVLRRMLEHEQEHRQQIREMMEEYFRQREQIPGEATSK